MSYLFITVITTLKIIPQRIWSRYVQAVILVNTLGNEEILPQGNYRFLLGENRDRFEG